MGFKILNRPASSRTQIWACSSSYFLCCGLRILSFLPHLWLSYTREGHRIPSPLTFSKHFLHRGDKCYVNQEDDGSILAYNYLKAVRPFDCWMSRPFWLSRIFHLWLSDLHVCLLCIIFFSHRNHGRSRHSFCLFICCIILTSLFFFQTFSIESKKINGADIDTSS